MEGGSKPEQFITGKVNLKCTKKKCRERNEMGGTPIPLTDSNFDEIINQSSLALVDFWAPWCGPCLALAPIIEELAKEYLGKILVGKLNVDENPEMAERFQIYSIPTILIMKNGREVERIIGLVPKKRIVAALIKHLG